MTPRETILKAFEGGKSERVPVTLFGAGMWSIHHYGTTFQELSHDPQKMADMLIPCPVHCFAMLCMPARVITIFMLLRSEAR